MTQFRADTSFPYLALSRTNGLPYRDVLIYSDLIERRYLHGGAMPDLDRLAIFLGITRPQVDGIYYTAKNERYRRQQAAETA